MRGDAALGDLMHVVGADLDLDAFAVRADHGRVQRLVAVGLGHGDVIFEAARNGFVGRMDHAERLVALGDVVDDDAKSDHVVRPARSRLAPLHLLVDRVEVLGPPDDVAWMSYSLSFSLIISETSSMILFALVLSSWRLSGELGSRRPGADSGGRDPRAPS